MLTDNGITEDVLQGNEGNMQLGDKEHVVTDMCKDKMVQYKDVISSFSTSLKRAEETEVPIHRIPLLRQLRYPTCDKQTEGTKQKKADMYIMKYNILHPLEGLSPRRGERA
jgi:formyltetrahydrofolate hydrolase